MVDIALCKKQQSGQRPGYNAYIVEEDGSKTVQQEWPERNES